MLVLNRACRVYNLPQQDDQQTRDARRVDNHTAVGFCKYHGNELEKVGNAGGVAVSVLWLL
jgi:hypothetical protein